MKHKFYIFKFSDKYDGLIDADLLKQLNTDLNLNKKFITTPYAKIPIIIY